MHSSIQTRLIIVNGIPGAAKSTIAAAIAQAWRSPLYSKDALKDVLASVYTEEPDARWLSDEADELLWFLVSRRRRAVIETWFGSSDRVDRIRERLAASGTPAAGVAEVWCDVPMEVARDRFFERARHDPTRHPRHLQAGADPMWWESLADVGPLGAGRTVRINTTCPVSNADVETLIASALAHSERSG